MHSTFQYKEELLILKEILKMKQDNKIRDGLRYRLFSFVITLAIAFFVYICQFSYFAGIITFIVADGIMGYWYKNKTTVKKAALSLNDNFNANYFDLYNEYKYNQWMFILKSVCLAFTICPLLHRIFSEIFSYISLSIGLAVIFFTVATIFSTIGKNSKALANLCKSKKENWFSEYTDDEKKIIQDLFGSPLT